MLRTLLTTAGHRPRRRGVRRRCTRRTRACCSRSTRRSIGSPGKTQLQVTAGETGFGEEVLERVQAAPTVRVAVPVIEAVVDTGDHGAGQPARARRGHDRRPQPARLRSRERRRGGHRRSAGVPGAARLAHRDEGVRRAEPPRGRQPDAARHDRGRQAVHRPRHHEVGRPDQRVRRQPRVMDIYAAQKMFGRGRTLRPDRPGGEAGPHDRRVPSASSRALLGPGFQVEPPSGRGQQFESMLRRLLDDGEHLEPVRAVHRDVHHLQLVRDRGDAAAVGDRHPARARARRAGRSAGCSSARAPSPASSDRSAALAFGVLIARGDRRLHRRRSSPTSTAWRSTPRSVATSPALLALARWRSAWRRAWSRRSIPARDAARVDPVQALQKGKYQVLSAGESRARAICGGRRCGAVSIACLCVGGVAVGLLRGLRARDRRAALLLSAAARRSRSRSALRPVLKLAAAGRRRAGRRQPDPGAAADLGERRRADAVARAGRRVRAGWRAPATTRSSTGWTRR